MASPVSQPEDKIIVYQIMTRLFGNQNTNNQDYGTIEENGVGKFNDVNIAALTQLKKLGCTHIWYTGVIEHAVLNDYTQFGISLDNANVVKGRAGSPYAIKDYYDVNPDLALDVDRRMEEFEDLIDRTHQQGLKVLIDFVPNHVARAYGSVSKPEGIEDLGEGDDTSVSFSPNNDYYYLPGEEFKVPPAYDPLGPDNAFPTERVKYVERPAKATGNNIFKASPSIDDWFETVKLNYGVDYVNGKKKYFDPIPSSWLKLHDILDFWTRKGIDGFRCDFVQFTPVEFWSWVIPKIKSNNPEILFIAEIYIPEVYTDYLKIGHFDYLYDKVQLYDTLRNILQGSASPEAITQVQQALADIDRHMIRFLENHDEQRIASPFFADDANKARPAMLVTAALGSGPVLIYFGQEVGEPGAGKEGFQSDDGRTTIFDYWGVPEHQKWMNAGKFDGMLLSPNQRDLRTFYSNLLNACNQYEALFRGKFMDLNQYHRTETYEGYSPTVYAWGRFTTEQQMILVTNFESGLSTECHLRVPEAAGRIMGFDSQGGFSLRDVLNPETEPLGVEDLSKGVQFTIEPLACHIFLVEPSG